MFVVFRSVKFSGTCAYLQYDSTAVTYTVYIRNIHILAMYISKVMCIKIVGLTWPHVQWIQDNLILEVKMGIM
jgi:hypothetical protein